MATMLSLATVGIGDLDMFLPSPPCLVVNTFYVDGEPESSVTYVWQDAATGVLRHELVYMQPAPFETALAWAEDHATTRSVERIHVRHALHTKAPALKAAARKPARKAAAKKAAVRKAAAKKTAAKRAPARKAARKAPAKRRAARKAAR